MNVLFISLGKYNTINEHGIYPDLLRAIANKGHKVYVVSPRERRDGGKTELIKETNCEILRVKTLNIQKTNIIEKGIGTVLLEGQIMRGIKKYFKHIKFDLVLYPTPPITIVKPVSYIKKRDNASTYLMLKDIFPQNSIDLGLLSKKGIKGILYRYFRKKEKKLYSISDRIGCMSEANVSYLLNNNSELNKDNVEVFPNCIEIQDYKLNEEEKAMMRKRYGLPLNKKIFVYGGNIGKPQGVPFLIECLKAEKNNNEAFFLIVGSGTEYSKLESFFNENKEGNFKLMAHLDKNDYDRMILSCDVGLIFLDYRFTIPNYPSRLLSLMQAGLPIIACTDVVSDVGKTIVEGKFGWWCASNDVASFSKFVHKACHSNLVEMSIREKEYLSNNFSVSANLSKLGF